MDDGGWCNGQPGIGYRVYRLRGCIEIACERADIAWDVGESSQCAADGGGVRGLGSHVVRKTLTPSKDAGCLTKIARFDSE